MRLFRDGQMDHETILREQDLLSLIKAFSKLLAAAAIAAALESPQLFVL